MRWNSVILWIVIVVCTMKVGYAQDPQFSQFYASPIYLNPALAGNTVQGRFVGNYRHQWPSIPGAFVSYAFSYDHNFSDLNSGIAFAVQRDQAGSAGLRYTNIAGMYAYAIQISRNLAVKPGLSFSYSLRDIDYTRLVFGDQLLSNNATSVSTAGRNDRVDYFDLGSGVVVYSQSYWVGLAMHHLNKPNQSLVGGESLLPIKTSLHGGYNIPLKRSSKKKTISSLTLAFNYKSQLKWDQFDIGGYFNYGPFVAGLWYRGLPVIKKYAPGFGNHESIIPLLGYKTEGDLSFGYSYDLTISKLLSDSGGAHEVSVLYEFASKRAKRKRRRKKFIVPCAKF